MTQTDDERVTGKPPAWAQDALEACLQHLPESGLTETRTVEVLDSWTEDNAAFCVVYRYPYFRGVLGIRCTFDTDMYGAPPTDAVQFGRDIADFEIGEPLGSVVERLRPDSADVYWWGDLDEELPRKPAG